MQHFLKHYSLKNTKQTEPIPGTNQLQNNAGGFAWEVDDWQRLDRFLLLGTEGGTYYVREAKLTVENAEAVRRCIQEDGIRVVNRIVEISESGRAPKNDPALFSLALCCSLGDPDTKHQAYAALPKVARIGTHLFHFLHYSQGFRGWGRALRRAIASWYNEKDVEALAFQMIKYQQRDGWSHRDALRLAHPNPASPSHNVLYHWVPRGRTQKLELKPRFPL
jgi:60 kDa SS-A/Ro ribonucleoprotein